MCCGAGAVAVASIEPPRCPSADEHRVLLMCRYVRSDYRPGGRTDSTHRHPIPQSGAPAMPLRPTSQSAEALDRMRRLDTRAVGDQRLLNRIIRKKRVIRARRELVHRRTRRTSRKGAAERKM